MNVARILAIGLGNEQDVVLVRQRARQVFRLGAAEEGPDVDAGQRPHTRSSSVAM